MLINGKKEWIPIDEEEALLDIAITNEDYECVLSSLYEGSTIIGFSYNYRLDREFLNQYIEDNIPE